MGMEFDMERGEWKYLPENPGPGHIEGAETAAVISFSDRKNDLRKFERGLSRRAGKASIISLMQWRNEIACREAMRNVHFIGSPR